MKLSGLAAAAALVFTSFGAMAAEAQVVRNRTTTVVRTTTIHRDNGRHDGWRNRHRTRQVCRTVWRHHHKIRTCRTVRR